MENSMAKTEMKLFEISIYDEGDGYKKDEVYRRYSSVYCAASSLESALNIVKQGVSGKNRVVGGSEKVDSTFYHE